VLRCGRHSFDLTRPLVMGILNVTPDSFSDGGCYLDPARALEHALRMREDGADLIDVGGESTRPGASPVPEEDEIARVMPIVAALAARGVAVSVDTRKPAVMRAAIDAGAAMINDVGALARRDACAQGRCRLPDATRGGPMQVSLRHADIVGGFRFSGARRRVRRGTRGPDRDRPALLARRWRICAAAFALFATIGCPVLVGLSKSSLGQITGREAGERLGGSLAAALAAVARGAAIVRVHDVRETVDALKVWREIECGG
jgi:dihydropteroate synthase